MVQRELSFGIYITQEKQKNSQLKVHTVNFTNLLKTAYCIAFLFVTSIWMGVSEAII